MHRALYPGSFDPVTNAHLDLIERSARIYDELIVAVAVNTGKNPLFSMPERVAMLEQEVGRFGNVRVVSFRGLAVKFAVRSEAQVILRGIRSFSDFEYELQMAHTNRHLSGAVETLFMISGVEWSFVSARLLKEALVMGADIGDFVPAHVHVALREKLCLTDDGDVEAG